jgi:hypothetical protein
VGFQKMCNNVQALAFLQKVGVNGTHQCDFLSFCGGLGLEQRPHVCMHVCMFNSVVRDTLVDR